MSSKYQKECRKHFNELGIYGGTDITRLIGYGEDEDDCYYLLRYPPDEKHGGVCKEVFASMVGGWFSIKNMGKRGYEYTQRNCHIPNAFEYTERLDLKFSWI